MQWATVAQEKSDKERIELSSQGETAGNGHKCTQKLQGEAERSLAKKVAENSSLGLPLNNLDNLVKKVAKSRKKGVCGIKSGDISSCYCFE